MRVTKRISVALIRNVACVLLLLVSSVTANAQASASSSGIHDRRFWRSIAGHHYDIPNDGSAPVLAQELSGLLASPDPELRDDLAYSILATWISRGQLAVPDLISLSDQWRTNLSNRIGESGTESVLKRSFSALCLASVAERDLKTPFLGEQRYRALLGDALAYLNQERDLRGYDEKLGWIHASAHTADLLQALATNPLFTKTDQRSVLTAISERLSSVREIYTHGEQDRLALTVAAILKRNDFDEPTFDMWLEQMQEADRAMWTHTPIPLDEMARYQNRTYFIEALAARLSVPPMPLQPAATRARDAVLTALKKR